MVKRQKEKLYQSGREQRMHSAQRAGRNLNGGSAVPQRRLPFGHCALTLQPYTEAVCNPENPGILYDSAAVIPFLLKWKRDPCTGAPLTSSQLVRLQMERSEEGEWQCPIMTKTLADHSKIVAIRQASSNRQTANVYSHVAYKRLNLQAKNYTDLLSGEPFDPKRDVLVLRDPDGPAPLAIEDFYYIQHAEEFPKNDDGAATDIHQSATANRVLAQLEKQKKKSAAKAASSISSSSLSLPDAKANVSTSIGNNVIMAQDVTGVALTTSAGAASFTSTGVNVSTDNAARPATTDEILQAQFRMLKSLKEKGHVRIVTNFGELVVEVHCDIVPQTATNFLGLCAAGRYDGTSFHRLIPKFMIQGGKASTHKKKEESNDKASAEEDASLWGGAFADEFDDRLKHDARGVLAMANAGPGTNKQQIYVTFAPCTHLDRKHSVFGKVVKGMEVLDAMEKVGRDNKDRPLEKITIERTEVMANPVIKANEKEAKRIEKVQNARLKKDQQYLEPAKKKIKTTNHSDAKEEEPSTVGKYLKDRLMKNAIKKSPGSNTTVGSTLAMDTVKSKAQQSKPKKSSFGNFSGW